MSKARALPERLLKIRPGRIGEGAGRFFSARGVRKWGIVLLLGTAAALWAEPPLRYEFRKQSDWGQGFVGEIRLTNTSAEDVVGWSLEFDLPQEITSLWGARIQSHKGRTYRLGPEAWSQFIPAGQSLSLGFQAAPGFSSGPSEVRLVPMSSAPEIVATSSGDVAVRFRVVSDWGSGFQAEVELENKGVAPIGEWSVSLHLPRRITSIWNARISSINGETYVLTGADWNQELAAGGRIVFGFLGAPGGLSGPPPEIAFSDAAPERPPRTPLPALSPSPSAAPKTAALPSTPTSVAPGEPSRPARTFNYAEALQLAVYFFDAQRSGKLPEGFRVRWRGDSGLKDGGEVDLTGGYYDAGDGMKFAFPMAGSMTLLSWGGILYQKGYQKAGEWENLLAAVRWGTDWLMKAHTGDTEFWGQVGRAEADHAFWGPPEAMTMDRPAFKIDRDHPGSDLAGEASAALTAASLLFRERDPAYASRCLDHARRLFAFADAYRGKYSDAMPEARAYYPSFTGYDDELAWAAAWLAVATREPAYLAEAEKIFWEKLSQRSPRGTQSWDEKTYGTAILLAALTGDQRYQRFVQGWLNEWAGGGVTRTAGGLAWMDQWGSLRYAANTAFLALVAADTVGDPNGRYTAFATGQINYILGANPAGRSYMIGFGDKFPRNPHHRAAHGSITGSISDPIDNRHLLYGALVGGPMAPDDDSYRDERTNYISNEVALDYNAGFTGALARLVQKHGGTPRESFPD